MFIRKWLLVLIILLDICLLPINTFAQTGEYDVKAVLLWRIAQYIEWPEETDMDDTTKPFVIAVFGRNPFGTVLEDVYLSRGQKIKNKNVEIRYLTEIDKINGCHILFISGSEGKRLDDILSRTKGKPILTVGDTQKFGENGVHINFYISNNKTRFELNESFAAAEGFNVDYRMRSIAKIVGRQKGGG